MNHNNGDREARRARMKRLCEERGIEYLVDQPDHPIYKRGFTISTAGSINKTDESGINDNVVTAKRALAIAATAIADLDEDDRSVTALELVDGDTPEWPFAPPRACYGAPTEFPTGCWVVYVKNSSWGTSLRSSFIIGVSKQAGTIIYTGSANDEG